MQPDASRKVCHRENCASDLRLADVGPGEMGRTEVGPGEDGPSEDSPGEGAVVDRGIRIREMFSSSGGQRYAKGDESIRSMETMRSDTLRSGLQFFSGDATPIYTFHV